MTSAPAAPRTIPIPTPVIQSAIDALCRAHKLCVNIDAARAILHGDIEIQDSTLTADVERSLTQLREIADENGLAW